MKVLILRFSSIGDIVLTTPVARALKTELDAEVHYATKAAYEELLTENPYIDRIFTLQDDLSSLVKQLKAENYDHIVDLHNNLRTRLVKLRLRRPSTTFGKLNWQKWLYVNFKVNRLPNRHVVDRYMDTVRPLGVKGDALGLDFFIPERDELPQEWLPESHRQEFVAVVVGAKFATKRLPTTRLIELCDRIGKPVVLLGGPDEADIGQEVERFFERRQENEGYEEGLRQLGKKTQIFNACGKLSLMQSASLVQQADYVFTHDTGLMHIAAAFRKEIFSIWGNTVLDFGMYPYRTKFTVFENNKLGCRPCSKIGFDKCPKGHFKCMQDVVFDFWLP